jgi:hypothetical protein
MVGNTEGQQGLLSLMPQKFENHRQKTHLL